VICACRREKGKREKDVNDCVFLYSARTWRVTSPSPDPPAQERYALYLKKETGYLCGNLAGECVSWLVSYVYKGHHVHEQSTDRCRRQVFAYASNSLQAISSEV
jgi:hypothetical protein